MAYEYNSPYPLRISDFLRNTSDIAYTIAKEDEMILKRRIETKANKLMRCTTWRGVQTLLEAEAISKVSMKEYLSKLRDIAEELSGVTSVLLDDVLVLVLHLFMQEPVTSIVLKQIMKHMFGCAASSIILHRICKVVNDIKLILPSYTLEHFKAGNRSLGKRQEKFGNHIPFVPVNRMKIQLPEISQLNEIALERVDENVEQSYIEDFTDAMNEEDKFYVKESPSPDKSSKQQVSEMQYFCYDDAYYEEISFHMNCDKFEELNFLLPVSQLSEVCQAAFKEKLTLNDIESVMYKPLFSCNENMIISLPLSTDKTSIVFLALLSLAEYSSYTTSLTSKMLYLVSSVQAVEQIAEKLRNLSKSLSIIVRSVISSTSINKTDLKVPQVIVTATTVWEVISQDMDLDLNSFKMLIIDEINCLGETTGPALEVVIARMRNQAKCGGTSLRMLGLTKSLLSLNCGPSFSDMAEYLEVKKNNIFIIPNQYPTVLPWVSLVKMKFAEKDNNKKHVEERYCNIVNNIVCNNSSNKVVVFVNTDEEVIHTAETMRKNTNRNQRNNIILSQKVKNKMLMMMEDENTDKMSRQLCSSGFLTIHSRMTASVRNYLGTIFRRGNGKLIVTTSNYASLLSNQADTIIIKEMQHVHYIYPITLHALKECDPFVQLVRKKKDDIFSICYKNTDIYDEENDTYVDIGITCLTEMMTSATYSCEVTNKNSPGNVTIIVNRNKFELYTTLLQNSTYVESQLLYSLPDFLNTEILVSGITNIMGCEKWFRYTYLYQKMKSRAEGIDVTVSLNEEVHHLISRVLQTLEKAGMIRYKRSGNFVLTEFGYIAHCHQIPHSTMEFLGKYVRQILNRSDILDVLCQAPVFSSVQVQAEDYEELISLESKFCKYMSNDEKRRQFKINVLLQSYLSGAEIISPILKLTQDFIVKKMRKVTRAMFEICLNKRNFQMAEKCLDITKMVENGCWKTRDDMITKLPKLQFETFLQPLSNSVIQVNFLITPDFSWNEDVDGDSALLFWIWIVDVSNNFICNYTSFRITKEVVEKKTCLEFSLAVKAVVPFATQYTTYVVSDKYLGVSHNSVVDFQHISLPDDHIHDTELLKLQLLPVAVLQNDAVEKLYQFHHFSPIITHTFHSLYHNDHNMLLMISSKRDRIIAAEIAIFRVMSHNPGSKVVYLTQWKSEIEERFLSWKNQLKDLGWKLCAFSGKTEKDIQDFLNVDIILSTVHHWELASRNKEIRKCLAAAKVSLFIVNDLQAFDASMESSLLRVIEAKTRDKIRVIGLSKTALTSSDDVACFLGISPESPNSVYSFVNDESVEVVGFSERHLDTAIEQILWEIIIEHLPSDQIAVILVPMKKDVVKTAVMLKNAVVMSHNPKIWRQNSEDICETQDANVGLLLEYGIGFLHSGLSRYDCDIVKTYVNLHAARILVMSIDVAGSIRLKIHLIVVKGTKIVNAKEDNVDIPVPELANIMYSCSSHWQKAFILTQDSKKVLYKSYFEGGLSVESHLLPVLPEYVNNEIVAGAIRTKAAAVEHLSQSFLGYRLARNPYHYMDPLCKNLSEEHVAALVDMSLLSLQSAGCITEDSGLVQATILGSLVSSYNLSHSTVKHLSTNLMPSMNLQEILLLTCKCEEFKHLSKKNQDNELVKELQKHSKWPVDHLSHVLSQAALKVFLLLQSHFSKLEKQLSILLDYEADVKGIVDSSYRIMQAVVVICCDRGWLRSAVQAQLLVQMLELGSWENGREPIFALPHVTPNNWKLLIPRGKKIMGYLPEIQALYSGKHTSLFSTLKNYFSSAEICEIHKALQNLPMINMQYGIYGKSKFWLLKDFYSSTINESISLAPETEYTLSVTFREADSNQENSWTLIMGCQEKKEVLAMKRMKSRNNESLLTFITPANSGNVTYTLYVMSNTHVGIDQQFDIHLRIVT